MHRAIRSLSTRTSRGQGMTEYIIIVALIAVAAVATYNFLGKTVRNQTGAIAAGLAGQESKATEAHGKAKDSAESATTEANSNTGLASFAKKVGDR